MQYGQIITDAIKLAWKHKWLWVLGFFLSMAESGGQVFNRIGDTKHIDLPPIVLPLLILIGLAAFVIFTILNVIAETALIVAVRDITREKATGLGRSLSDGLSYFWRILGIIIVTIVVAIVGILMIIVPVVLTFVAHVVLGILFLLFAIPLFILFIASFVTISSYAMRLAIVEEQGFVDSIGNAVALFRGNFGKSMALAFIALGVQIVIGIISFLIIISIALPFIAAGFVNLWLGIIPGAIILLIALAFLGGITGAYSSSYWTLAFMRLRELSPPTEEVPSEVV